MKSGLVPSAIFAAILGVFVTIGLSFTPKKTTPLPIIQGIKLPKTIHHRFLVYDVKEKNWIDGYNNNPADPHDPWAEPTPIPR